LNAVLSCSSIDYLSSDVVTRKLGLGINTFFYTFIQKP